MSKPPLNAPPFVSRELSGWGLYPRERCNAYRPERVDELPDVVTRAEDRDLAMRGLGRSYGDASLNGGSGVVLSEGLDRMIDFDPENAVLTCEAAVSLAEIMDVMLPRGLFFPVTPGTKYITVGGAIAADVHGKNHHRDGSMASMLLDFKLVTASGETLLCSREENSELFWATLGGMGLTGFISEARLQLREVASPYLHVDYEQTPNLDTTLERSFEDDENYAYAATWIDCIARGPKLGRSVLMRANPAPTDELPAKLRKGRAPRALPKLSVPFNFPGFVLNNTTMGLFNEFFNFIHPTRTTYTSYDSYLYTLDSVLHWNRIYGSRGVLQYQFLLPYETSRQGLIETLELLPQTTGVSFLAVLKSFGPASSGLLSFPEPGYTLALDFPNTGPELFAALAKLEQVVLKYGGRVYLAKDCCLSPEGFRTMYPRLRDFQEIKAKVDPEQRFSSSLARRLGIVEDA